MTTLLPPTKDRHDLTRRVLAAFGHGDAVVDEVSAYCANPFDWSSVSTVTFPLTDEPHVADWRRYKDEAGSDLWNYLQSRVPQFSIPIAAGTSTSAPYGAVIRKGQPFRAEDFGGTLQLEAPGEFELQIHEHPMGALPVLITATRSDFEQVYRALAHRHEPVAVNASVNAQMIAGLVNWDRVNRYRERWSRRTGEAAQADAAPQGWQAEMGRVAKQSPELFYDRLILVTRAPYGGRTARELGVDMEETAWQRASTALRMEHEFAHYATKRLYGTMRLNLLDELIADAMGMTHALGAFRSTWFLGALGLKDWPEVPSTARVHTYRGDLSDEGFRLACEVSAHAAQALESMPAPNQTVRSRGRYLLTLSALTLDVLASPEAKAAFDEAWTWAGTVVGTDK